MDQLFADLAEFIERHRAWAAPVLGLITFGESMVFIGAFFPATVLMVAAGGLVGAGVLHPVPVLLWCIAGAAAGDAISYWIGRRVGPSAARHRWLRPHRRAIARARLFFRRHGAASIYLCRFMGPVRAFVPLSAGMMAMNHRRFQIANVGSALVWVPVMLAPGYLAAKGVNGMGLAGDSHALTWIVLGAVGLVLAGALAKRWAKARWGADVV